MAKSASKTKKAKTPKIKSGVVWSEFHPAWLDDIAPECFNNVEFFRIVIFFVFHSPVEGLSAMGKSLDSYNWSDAWKKPKYLQRELKNASTNPFLLYSAQTIDDMAQAVNKADLSFDVPVDISTERIAFYNGKKNQFMSVFYHMRDSFAHGRLNMYELQNDPDDFVFVFEDIKPKEVTGRGYKVTARMVLRKSTLIKWIEIIEGGYVEKTEADDGII